MKQNQSLKDSIPPFEVAKGTSDIDDCDIQLSSGDDDIPDESVIAYSPTKPLQEALPNVDVKKVSDPNSLIYRSSFKLNTYRPSGSDLLEKQGARRQLSFNSRENNTEKNNSTTTGLAQRVVSSMHIKSMMKNKFGTERQ